MVQDCADTRNYPTELAPNMLAAGRGTDGQEGSLCTAVLAKATAEATKRESPQQPHPATPTTAYGDSPNCGQSPSWVAPA